MRTSLLMAVVLATALTASPGFAQEVTATDIASKQGAFGIGANKTLGGIEGINFRTYVTARFGLIATLGLSYTSQNVVDAGAEVDRSTTSFRTALYGAYKLSSWQSGHLSMLFGLDFASLSRSDESMGMTTDASASTFGLGTGLGGEVFLHRYLSVFASTGLVVSFLGPPEIAIDDGQPVDDVSGTQLDLVGDLWARAGFTIWFN